MSRVPKRILQEAISFAARAHLGQLRKDDSTPYVAHPFRVMTLLIREFGVEDEEVLAAAVLHDTIEDTTIDRDDLIETFGPRIAGWVAALSKDKRLEESERESKYFEQLVEASHEVKLCKLADCLDNLFDSSSLSDAARRKSRKKAAEAVELLGPGLPEEWQHVPGRIEQAIRAMN